MESGNTIKHWHNDFSNMKWWHDTAVYRILSVQPSAYSHCEQSFSSFYKITPLEACCVLHSIQKKITKHPKWYVQFLNKICVNRKHEHHQFQKYYYFVLNIVKNCWKNHIYRNTFEKSERHKSDDVYDIMWKRKKINLEIIYEVHNDKWKQR